MKKWYAVIGNPIAQSMSPAMHDEWLKEAQVDATYIPIHIPTQDIESAIQSLKKLGCSGWNVTVPHKSAVIPFLDRIDDSAKQMNAVNTVRVAEDGALIGSNTDGTGFVRSLEEKFGTRCKEEQILIIGAGGAARGIAFALQEAGYGSISFANRTMQRAELLASQLQEASVLSMDEAADSLSKFGLIVQTTSVGMSFSENGMPFDPVNIRKGAVVTDIIYNPLETAFLAAARTYGAETMNGLGMFVHQGALAFEAWTGTKPNTTKMIDTLTKKLGGTIC